MSIIPFFRNFKCLDNKNKEKNQNLRIAKKWEFQKKRILHECGVWKEKKEPKPVSFKLNKYSDSIFRRHLLKIYKDADKKEYLNLKTYKERKRSLKLHQNSKSIENSKNYLK